jgi:hypothetical protein
MKTIPRPEHPRPYFQRADWQSLNGKWRFAFDPDLIGEQMRWYLPSAGQIANLYGPPRHGGAKNLEINVPFPWESKLSGVERTDYKGAAWYEREIFVPSEWEGKRVYLNFEAVDWQTRVWINGVFAGENENGYLPFSIDLSRFVQPGETAYVVVRAFDVADASTMVGKQVPRWYTYSSGIWGSVWLEARASNHVKNVRVAPNVPGEQAQMRFDLCIAEAGAFTLNIAAKGDTFTPVSVSLDLDAGDQQVDVTVPVFNPQLWSPETPFLYDFTAELQASDGVVDHVDSYFGMRTVERAKWDGKAYEYILLNGEPVYLRGALDQAFHPDGLHSYPSDDVIKGDIQLAKDLGLNMLRCHIKINDPRYYYWADRLGLLIMYDIPCADLDTPAMRRMYEAALPRAIARDFNSPSIFAWVLFNETWGLTEHRMRHSHLWVQEMVALAHSLDPSRLVEDNSPCHYNHVESDINSWHYYINDYPQVRKHIQMVVDETYPGSDFNYVGDEEVGEFVQSDAPLMNSEFGGISAKHGDQDIAWCFKYQTSELRKHDKICGYVYTELDDIEWEHNGFVNYDRSAKEFGYDAFVPGMTVADLNGADFVGCDVPPCQTVRPGGSVDAPIFVSHWGLPMAGAQVHWQVDFTDRFGVKRVDDNGMLDLTPKRFEVTDVGPLALTMPDEPGLATLALVLVDESGAVRARNYVNVEVRAEQAVMAEGIVGGRVVRFAPGAFTRTSWPRTFTDEAEARFSATGSGWVEYRVMLPIDIDRARIAAMRLQMEAGARVGFAKVDWPQKTFGLNYPQTEVDRKTPSDMTISVNGVAVDTVRLPDDPADARGVLSHHVGIDPGAYGYLVDVPVGGEALASVAKSDSNEIVLRFEVAADADCPGGLAFYGATCGSLPVDPTLIIEMI